MGKQQIRCRYHIFVTFLKTANFLYLSPIFDMIEKTQKESNDHGPQKCFLDAGTVKMRNQYSPVAL